MSDQTEIFDNKDPQTQDPAPATPEVENKDTEQKVDPYSEALKMIVDDEGRQKYESVGDGLKALQYSQQHIAKIEAENAEMRGKLENATDIKEALEAKASPSNEGLSQEDVANLVAQQLQANEAQKVEKANAVKVRAALEGEFGDEAQARYIEKVSSTGLTVQQMDSLAKSAPDAALKLLGIDSKPSKAPAKTSGGIVPPAAEPQRGPTKSVMFAASDGDRLAAWRASAPTEN